MKKTRRFAAFVAALTLAACAVAPSMMFASAADYEITFDQGENATNTDKTYAGDSATHTYEAYQIFKGTLTTQTTGSGQDAVTKKILSDIDWGTGVDFTKAGKDLASLVTALQADNTIEVFSSVTTVDKTEKQVAQDIADALKTANNDDVTARFFAKTIAGYLSTTKVTGSESITVAEANAGYYLIQDAADSPSGATTTTTTYALKAAEADSVKTALADVDALTDKTDAEIAEWLSNAENWDTVSEKLNGYTSANDVVDKTETSETAPSGGAKTRYILTVVDSVTVKVKSDVPSVIKKVQENENGKVNDAVTFKSSTVDAATNNYNDVADYNIGDSVPFKLYGSLPGDDAFDDYEHYYYKFTDTLGSEFDAPAENAVTVNVDGQSVDSSLVDIDVTGNVITVTFADIKAVTDISASSIITVEYTATLNSNAVVGLPGQQNEVYLTYSSNPNEEYDGTGTPDDTEDSPKDKVIVFTYELDIQKQDEDEEALAGAQFAVKATDGNHANQYVIVTKTGDAYKVSGWSATAPTKVTGDDLTTAISGDGVVNTNGKGSLFVSSGDKEKPIVIAGLDDGNYSIEEIEAPDGYNKLGEAEARELAADTNNIQNWDSFVPADAITKLELKKGTTVVDTDDANCAKVTQEIENKSGTTLPSTGGIGTTLFYLAGGVMVVGAGVVLVTKKRIGKED